MFENLLNLVKENAGDAVIRNPAVPDSQNDAVIEHATNGIMDGLKEQLANGKLQDVLSLLGGQSQVGNNNVVTEVSGNVMKSLMEKFHISGADAGKIVTSLLPAVFEKLIHRTNDPTNSSFDLNSIFSALSGGKTSGFDMNSILHSFNKNSTSTNTANDNQGGFDLKNVINSVTGGEGGMDNILNTFKSIFNK